MKALILYLLATSTKVLNLIIIIIKECHTEAEDTEEEDIITEEE